MPSDAAIRTDDQTQARDELVAIIERGLRANRRGLYFLAGFVVVLGVLGIAFLDPGETGTRLARKAIFGAYALPVIGVALAIWATVKKSAVRELVAVSSPSIVSWHVEDRGQHGVHLVVGAEDGSKHSAPLMGPDDVAPVKRLLPRVLPSATAS